jgi:hypothetical protein
MCVRVIVLFVEDLRRQAIEGNEISDLFIFATLNHICINDTVFRKKTMSYILLCQLWCKLELCQMNLEQCIYLRDVFGGHLSVESSDNRDFNFTI